MVPQRQHPAHGVFPSASAATIVFLTVCTKDRRPWLATPERHALLRAVWSEASAWLVGRYVLTPDHLHLFAGLGPQELPLDNWVRYWKSRFSKRQGNHGQRWQTDHWDTRLRTEDSYEEKWEYVRNNPVRHCLVSRAEDWPYQGKIHSLRW
jgi:putative transposase